MNNVIVSGIAAIGLTAFVLGSALVIIKIRQYRAKKRYKELIEEKMNILATLQEELKDREVSEEEPAMDNPNSELPPQTPLPAQFFETNYTEVKV